MVHLADHALVRAGRGQRGRVRAADARQPDRDDERGLHPHGAGEGPDRAHASCARACARRSTRSSRCSALEIGVLLGGAVLVETVFNIPGVGPPGLPRDRPLRLRSDPGHGAAGVDVHHHREHRRRHRLRVSRSEGAATRERPTATVPEPPSASRCCASRTCASSSRAKTAWSTPSTASPTRCSPGKTLGIVGESGSGKTVSSLTTLGLTRLQGAQRLGAHPVRGPRPRRAPRQTSCARSAATTSR